MTAPPTASNPSHYRRRVFIVIAAVLTLMTGVLFMIGLARVEPPPVPPAMIHGIVVDEHGTPIPGVKVDCVSGGRVPDYALTGPDGRFAIAGNAEVLSLGLYVVESGGQQYWPVPYPNDDGATSFRLFRFVDDPSLRTRHDTPGKACVLTVMRRLPEGRPYIKPTEFVLSSVNPAGTTPVTIAVNDQHGPTPHTVQILYHSKAGPIDPSSKPYNRYQKEPELKPAPYAWGATISVPGGTIVEKDPKQAIPEAPETGFASTATIDVPATLARSDWRTSTRRYYYLHFADGTYGILTLHIGSRIHGLRGKVHRNPQPGERDLTGNYIFPANSAEL